VRREDRNDQVTGENADTVLCVLKVLNGRGEKMRVHYEMQISYVHDAIVDIPIDILVEGENAVKEWINDNVKDDVKDYGDCEIKTTYTKAE